MVYTFPFEETQIPFGVAPGRASGVKICQIKYAEQSAESNFFFFIQMCTEFVKHLNEDA